MFNEWPKRKWPTPANQRPLQHLSVWNSFHFGFYLPLFLVAITSPLPPPPPFPLLPNTHLQGGGGTCLVDTRWIKRQLPERRATTGQHGHVTLSDSSGIRAGFHAGHPTSAGWDWGFIGSSTGHASCSRRTCKCLKWRSGSLLQHFQRSQRRSAPSLVRTFINHRNDQLMNETGVGQCTQPEQSSHRTKIIELTGSHSWLCDFQLFNPSTSRWWSVGEWQSRWLKWMFKQVQWVEWTSWLKVESNWLYLG